MLETHEALTGPEGHEPGNSPKAAARLPATGKPWEVCPGIAVTSINKSYFFLLHRIQGSVPLGESVRLSKLPWTGLEVRRRIRSEPARELTLVKLLSPVRLCDPMDCSPPGSSLHGILQARVLEWVAIPFSRGSSDPGIEPGSPALQADALTSEPPGKPELTLREGISRRESRCYSRIFLLSADATHGEGNGSPLQCSCLENPRDGGAWRAIVCGVAQSRARLSTDPSGCCYPCVCVCVCVCARSDISDSLPSLRPWNSPGKNTGGCCHFTLPGIIPTQGSNPCLLHLLHCRWILYT